MKLKYFGDSYDIVKKSLIEWLWQFGPWVTHPMFTEEISEKKAAAFSHLIGTPLINTDILLPNTNRTEYFAQCLNVGNLFLDPDTGLCLEPRFGAKSVNYVFGTELIDWCKQRRECLTLVFDQSYSRGTEKRVLIKEKLNYFSKNGISGLVYDSHATFLLLGAEEELIEQGRQRLIMLGLPESRLIQ